MKRQIAIFVSASIIISVISVALISQTLKDLTTMIPVTVTEAQTTFTLKPATGSLDEADLDVAHQVIAHRLDQLKLNGRYTITVQEDEQQLRVTLPKNDDTPYVVNVITHVGEVAFIDGGADLPPIGKEIEIGAFDPTLFSGKDINTIVPPSTDTGEIFYQITLQPEASQRFDKFNAQSDHYICLVLDKAVTNCSKMYHWSNNKVDILPNLNSADGLSLPEVGFFLASGPLPTPLELIN